MADELRLKLCGFAKNTDVCYSRGGHSQWEVIWVCAALMTHHFTPISSSGDPNFKSICSSGAPILNFRPKSSKVAQKGLKAAQIAHNYV